MTRVLVIGGGAAAVAAAEEAVVTGPDITVIESSAHLAPDRTMFPYLLSGRCGLDEILGSGQESLLRRLGIEVLLGRRVQRVDPAAKSAQMSGPGTETDSMGFDSLVIATGSRNLPEDVRGTSKTGVFLLDTAEDYLSLGGSASRLTKVALLGSSAPLALLAAEQLSKKVSVVVFLNPGALERFSPAIWRRLARASISHGVAVVEGGLRSITGLNRVEAVVSSDSVTPCDAVAILPRSVPSLPAVPCRTGAGGGAMVDRAMRTSVPGIFAAGDCAEPRVGTGSIPFRLRSAALVMGRTAGRNAAGGRPSEAGLAGALGLRVFETELFAAGISYREGLSVGLDLVEMEDATDPSESAVTSSIVFERSSHRIYGAQATGPGALSLSDYLSSAVSSHTRLEEIVDQESPYPQLGHSPSPIRLTAGEFLKRLKE